MPVNFTSLKDEFSVYQLFEGKVWKTSNIPFPLSREQIEKIRIIGEASVSFYYAIEQLYCASKENKSLLRNKNIQAPWVAKLYDTGKPKWLLDHAQHPEFKRKIPPIIRPDLLLTEEGFALTELDSIPGGIGLTAFLNNLYKDNKPVSPEGGMALAFYNAVCRYAHNNKNPTIGVIISDDAATYRPEFEWLSDQLLKEKKPLYCFHPDDIFLEDNKLKGRNQNKIETIDIVYRFYELFELEEVSCSRVVAEAAERKIVQLTPPMRPFQEEKLSFTLFHHPQLREFFREVLTSRDFSVLNEIIPKSWLLDPTPLPTNAILHAPWINGSPPTSWDSLGNASQKEREFILKISGFHATAWGSRSVTLGSDVSSNEWQAALKVALMSIDESPYILQEYKKPKLVTHPIYDDKGKIQNENLRVRLCPYFTQIDKDVEILGILATLCPADKKIIHGMSDAALLPVSIK